MNVMLFQFIFQFKSVSTYVTFVWHNFMFHPLMIYERASLGKRLAANVAFERPQPLVHLHVTSKIVGRATFQTTNVAFMRLSRHIVFRSVVSQTRFMDKWFAALLASDRSFPSVREHVVFEMSLAVGAPTAYLAPFSARIREMNFSMAHQICTRGETFPANLAGEGAHSILVRFQMRLERFVRNKGFSAGGANERSFSSVFAQVDLEVGVALERATAHWTGKLFVDVVHLAQVRAEPGARGEAVVAKVADDALAQMRDHVALQRRLPVELLVAPVALELLRLRSGVWYALARQHASFAPLAVPPEITRFLRSAALYMYIFNHHRVQFVSKLKLEEHSSCKLVFWVKF
jgi:hypothetical protein